MTPTRPIPDPDPREAAAIAAASSSICLLLVDGEGRLRHANRLPATPGDNRPGAAMVGADVREALAPMVVEGRELLAAIDDVRRTGAQVRLTAIRPGPIVDARWDLEVRPVPGGPDVLLQFVSIRDDDRERVAGDGYRRFSEDVLRSLGSGLAVVDDRGAVLVTNEPAARILETTRDALRAGGLSAILGPETAADVLAGRFDDPARGPFDVIRRLDGGREIHLGFSLSLLSDKGRRTGRILHFKDITEIQRLKARVVHQAKMAAIGSLAGGVAHEFNNLIGGMLGYAQLARATHEPRDVEKCLDVVHEASLRAKDIVTSLLTFARRPEGALEHVRLTDLVDQTLVLVERAIEKKGIRIVRQYEYRGALFVDSSRLQVVLLHLLTNARDAMDAGGTLTVRTFDEGDRVFFTVADTGHGIAVENLPRVFEPFYTTKGAMGGSLVPGHGLGLSECYGIVQGMQGEITVDSTVGVGSRFTVELPRIESVAAVSANLDTPETAFADETTVRHALVVDPDPAGGEALARVLRRLGVAVSAVRTWENALAESQYHVFDFVFHARGDDSEYDLQCRRAIEIENPEARFIACAADIADAACDGETLRKPYAFADVVRALAGPGPDRARDRSDLDARR
jgi:signal transduction histidine kinase